MKRMVCLLFCLLLLCGAAPAAGEETDIAELMARQVGGNSALRLLLTLEADGEVPFFADADTWDVLRAVLPGLSLEGSYMLNKAGESLGDSQMTFGLVRDGETLGTLTLSGRGDGFVLEGTLLGDTVLALPRDRGALFRDRYITLAAWGGALLRDAVLTRGALAPAQAGQWPRLGVMLGRIGTGEAAADGAIDAALEPCLSELSAWLQERTALSLETGADGRLTAVSTARVSLRECAQEALTVLRMIYQDEALLALLREQTTESEAQAYLESGMLPLFEAALESVSGEETAELERRYDAQGALTQLRAALPFAGGRRLEIISGAEGFTLRWQETGGALEILAQGDEKDGYTGTFALTRGETRRAGGFQLRGEMGAVTHDGTQAGHERQQQGALTLTLTPEEGQPFPEQSLTVQIDANAGEADNQAARWNADIVWRELSSTATLHATLRLRTAAAIPQSAPGAATVSLEAADGASLVRGLWERLAAALLLPAAPAEEPSQAH